MLSIALQVAAGYAIADAIGGLFHLVTDRGYGLPFMVRNFQNHHERPWTMTFDLEPVVGAIPFAVLACYALPWLFGSIAFGVAFTQVPHYFIHHPDKCPRWMKALQRWRICLSKDAHDRHHTAPFAQNFCILAGWNDWWINRLARATE